MSDDIHALSGAYAVDALDDIERAQFEQHLAGCPACQAEVMGLREAAAELSAGLELAPPPGLRDRVMRDITTVRPLPPAGPTPVQTPPRPALAEPPAPRRWSRWLLAAAAAVVVGVGGVAAWRAADQPPPSVATQVLDDTSATRVSQTFPGGAKATLVRSATVRRAVLVTSQMPPAPAGKVYQLWLQDTSGHMSSAGLMPAGSDQVVLLQGDASRATAAGISVEPAGGSAQPTTDPIALFPLA